MKKPIAKLFILAVSATTATLAPLSSPGEVLFQDSSNYPYADGCIEGQGQWYCYSPKTKIQQDANVTNNVLYLNSTNTDSVGTPTNGWANSDVFTYASFTINVSQLPKTANGGYFCQFQDKNDTNDCCHLFIDTLGTGLPGTYRLGIGNYVTSFSSLVPPNNFPLDLSTGITYTVVIQFDNDQVNPFDTLTGAYLWVNPSEQDFQNAANNDEVQAGVGVGYAYGTDTTSNTNLLGINIAQIGFSPYVTAGISNVIVGTTFDDVNTTNPPVIGIQPQSQSIYSGNSLTFYTVASGADLTYQWYSQNLGGPLHDDGVNVIGSTSNILVVNNLQASDTYYVIVTDAYGQTATSDLAASTINTTPTAPFFPSLTGINVTNNLFLAAGFTNVAQGTGPLYYQWYFAPTNTPITYVLQIGQTNSSLVYPQLGYAQGGSYYVVASNAFNGGTNVYGPTNTLTVVAPIAATIAQLHGYMAAVASQITAKNTVNINTNANVTVSGYVTSFGALNKSTATYSEFFIQDGTNGLYVFYSGTGVTNTLIPPVGSYVTVSGPIAVFEGELECEPVITTPNSVTINTNVPIAVPAPLPGNGNFFAQVATNAICPAAIAADCTLYTLTNLYVYNDRKGTPIPANTKWYPNGYTTLYLNQGPYNVPPGNTNTIELFVPAYQYSVLTNLWAAYEPSYLYQLTGPFVTYGGNAEIELTRIPDMVLTAPAAFPAGVTTTAKGVPNVNWPAQLGSTYSVYSATSVTGPWTNQAFGLSYYPSTGTYTDTNAAKVKFYRVSTP